MMRRRFERQGRKIMDSDFVSLQKISVENEDVATDEECEAEKCEAGVWEEGEDVSESAVFRREGSKIRGKMNASMGNNRGGLVREKTVQGGKI